MKKTLLFVSNDIRLLRSWKRWFNNDFNVLTADDAHKAFGCLRKQSVELLVSDLHLEQVSGDKLLTASAQQFPETLRMLVAENYDQGLIDDLLADGIIHQFVNNLWDKEIVSSAVYSLSCVRPKQQVVLDTESSEAPTASESDHKELPAVMLYSENQSQKNSIRSLCKTLHLRSYSINNFQYIKETLELRPEIGLVLLAVDTDFTAILEIVERIKSQDKTLVIICLFNGAINRDVLSKFTGNANIFRCCSGSLSNTDMVDLINEGISQSIKEIRMSALMSADEKSQKTGESRLKKIKGIFGNTA